MSENPEEHMPPQGFAIPVSLGQLMDGLGKQHDRQHMAHDAIMMRVSNFLDELSVEQLMTLRFILNMDQDSATNNFVDGQIHTILRRVHHVDPSSGRPDVPC